MKVYLKTLKGTSFELEVKLEDTVADVKRNIENAQGSSVYPAGQQILIYQGKILKDAETMDENQVSENSFIVIMLRKAKNTSAGASATTTTTSKAPSAASSVPANPSTPTTAPAVSPAATLTSVPATAPTAGTMPVSAVTEPITEAAVYGQAASNLVAGNSLEQTIQQILDMGGGTWDRDIVIRALRAAFNNPERAVEYLYSGIPDQGEAPPVARAPTSGPTHNPPVQATHSAEPAVPSRGPNTNPLDLFPQGLPSMGSNTGAGGLDILQNSPQFRTLLAIVQANPQILQPMLQELAKQNPQIMQLIDEHQGEFLRLINEPAEGAESNLLSQLTGGVPQQVTVTQEENEAIQRLEAIGFDRPLVLEVFFACNKNEELAANYLLDHMHEFDE